ncbi:hypothetical protein [Nitrososphaera sp.]|uniref:hypothetical protein n=1 Tax=Nitrososphaera sp. TaxID=1971748 RepID=UPI00179D8C57|nr:hypothetical protein [Nitrososphaera sp.]NWG37521.1 hypothetical protein [Nitrososphaera sp.]
MTGLRQDLDAISEILHETFKVEGFKRDYDATFAKVASILRRYGIEENPRNLRFRFILCMQEFFDGMPQDQWRVKDPAFVKQSEEFAISRFRDWVIEQVA